MNTPLDTKAIRVVAEASTPNLVDMGTAEGYANEIRATAFFDHVATMDPLGPDPEADARLFVNARDHIIALCDELDELRATLANERGEGEPPGEGWEPCLEGERHDNPDGSEDIVTRWFKPLPGLWLYAGTSAAEHGWWWSVLGRTSANRRVCMARGNAPTAREAMRSAMNAADKTRSPA